MDNHQQLTQKRAQIMEQINALGPMRKGSITEQHLPRRRADGSIHRRGPYQTYTFKRGGKTCGKHLRDGEEADLYRRQIEIFRRYQELADQLVEVSQRLADLEAAGKGKVKKKLKR